MRLSNQNIIRNNVNAFDALTTLNSIGKKRLQTLFIIDDDDKLLGTLSDGDIRRGLIKGLDLKGSVLDFVNKNYHFLEAETVKISVINEWRESGIELIPILENGRLLRLIDATEYINELPIQALIMAGGEGKRLRPLTKDTPKPLLKIGDLPIIEYGVKSLSKNGIKNITISINYLGDKIVSYFKNRPNDGLEVDFVKENQPLGTAGALGLMSNITAETVLLMNSDLLTTINYRDFYEFFLQQGADMAIAAIPYNVSIPYAVLETEGHLIKNLKEKPIYTYYSNAGIYLIKKSLIDNIKSNEHLDATDLIERVIENGGQVVIFHLLDYWLDIGRMDDFKKAQEDVKHLNFK